ncbi:MAG: hypothetical protein QOI20_742 [Acidimicrobiaceae bacterium]|jgi:hypothetical protein|nr:hypothetical protein [Acidimicrobiaceae bacterium]
MKRTIGRLSFLLAIVTAVAMVGTNSAYAAAAGTGVVEGSGTISPGISEPTPLTGTPQTFSFNGTIVGAFVSGTNAYAGTVNCSFNGSDPNASVVLGGPGPVGGSCSGTMPVTGATISISAPGLTFVRAGAVVVVTGSADVCIAINSPNSCNRASVVATLAFVAGGFPVTNYSVAGTVTAAGA